MKIKPAILVQTKEELFSQLNSAASYTNEVDIDIINWARTPLKTISMKDILSTNTNLAINLDLMEDDPRISIQLGLSDPRVKMIIINSDCKQDIEDMVKQIESQDKLIGISLNPEDNIDFFINNEVLMEHVSLMQIMTVEPGSQGNPFLQHRLEVSHDLRKAGFKGIIQLDGGINEQTCPFILSYPVDSLSVGSALSKATDPGNIFLKLNSIFNSAQK